jgi:hypothetical protein
MTQFDDRERALEKKFELDEEHHQRAEIRALKYFGSWVAKHLSLDDNRTSNYISHFIDDYLKKPDVHAIVKKAEKDLHANGHDFTPHRLEKEMNNCENRARQEMA